VTIFIQYFIYTTDSSGFPEVLNLFDWMAPVARHNIEITLMSAITFRPVYSAVKLLVLKLFIYRN